ncbi:MAG TPA: hypothetical protein VNE21_05640 [Mycobacteriales bacterium]|nr:hypothetical protein [Mycobacteriales bacterium]
MAATVFTLQTAGHAGLNPVTQFASLGGFTHTAPCGAGIGLVLINGAASTVLVTLHVPAATTFDGLAIPSRLVTLPATIGAVTIIPLVASTYGDPVTGLCTFDVAAGTVSGFVTNISQ